ncbi:hypothetical protein [Rhodococcus yananensis]|uniref:hypothetical protein n=1 Tax=Rhodococcus yananensis TaxID=2879464 RepID=UPI001CF86F66|nr:hypothetical protein [Rhodococcus yananensis]
MSEHRHESGDQGSQGRMLALLVPVAVIAVGAAVVVFTGSIGYAVLFGLVTGGCIVVAHVMISPGPVVTPRPGRESRTHHRRHHAALEFRRGVKPTAY